MNQWPVMGLGQDQRHVIGVGAEDCKSSIRGFESHRLLHFTSPKLNRSNTPFQGDVSRVLRLKAGRGLEIGWKGAGYLHFAYIDTCMDSEVKSGRRGLTKPGKGESRPPSTSATISIPDAALFATRRGFQTPFTGADIRLLRARKA